MNEIIDWMQSNWYELGSLTAQFMFLFAGLWFARKILKTMRASQQQFGALLKLSMTDGLEEQMKESEATHSPTPSVVAGRMFTPAADRATAPARSSAAYSAFERPARAEAPSLSDELSGRARTSAPVEPTFTEPTQESTPYMAAPLTLPEEEHNGSGIAAAGRGVVRWLQTPMASRSGTSPLRRIVRWLQAPARS